MSVYYSTITVKYAHDGKNFDHVNIAWSDAYDFTMFT
jgi:hypothetical protein